MRLHKKKREELIKLVLLCKQKALYVKACIIANGITDSQGDTLYAEDIKKIFTSFNNQDNFEIHHNDLPISEVTLLENYISTADETIGTSIVPAGSWMAVIRVDNPEIQEGLLNGEFKGVSLNNRIAEACKANLHGQIKYSDIADAECVIPLLISFVKAGANGYGLHVMDYDAYIKKSKTIETSKGAKKMAFDLLGGLKKLVQQAEADNEPVILKEDDPEKEEETKEEVVEETTTKEPSIQKEDNCDSENKKEDDDAEIKKEEEEDDFEARVIAIVEKVLAEKNKEKNESDEEPETTNEKEEDTPKIVKSSKVITEQVQQNITNTNYYTISGRDPVTGCKIRE